MRLAYRSGVLMSAILITIFSGFANAVGESINELENITVTATRVERELKDVSGTVSIINQEEIEKNLNRDIRDLIRYEPGVSVSGRGRFGLSGFTIRGIGGDRVLTQVDGIPTVDEFSFGPFLSARRDFVDVDALKTAEIIRGPASSIYGSDALGGVVSFITKDPEDYLADTGKPLYFSTKTGYSSEDSSWLGTGTLAAGNDNLKGMLIYTYRDGEETETNGSQGGTGAARGKADPQDFENHNVLGKIVFDLNESHRFRVTGEYFQSDTASEILSASNIASFRGAILTQTNESDDTRERYRFSLGHEYEGNTALFNRSKIQLHIQDSETTQRLSQERISFGTPQVRSRNSIFSQDIFGVDLQLDKSLSVGGVDHYIIYGFDYESTDSKSIRDGGSVNAITGAVIPGRFPFPTRDFPLSETTEYAFFLQNEISLMDGRLLITPGVRYDRYEMEPEADAVFLSGNPGVPVPEEYEDDQVSFKIGVVFHINDNYSLFGQFAEGFRAPPFDDVNVGFTNFIGGYTTLSNPDLVSESSDSFELGLRGGGSYGSFSLTGFYNKYDNFIESLATRGFNRVTGLSEFQAINREEVDITGVEFKGTWNMEASFPALRGFYARASLAYAHGQDEQIDEPLNTIDPFKGVFGLTYRPNDKWNAELILTAVASKDRIDNTAATTEFFATPGFVTLDLLGEYHFNEHAHLNLGVFNLTDKKYWDWCDVIGREQGDVSLDRFSRPGVNASVSFRYIF